MKNSQNLTYCLHFLFFSGLFMIPFSFGERIQREWIQGRQLFEFFSFRDGQFFKFNVPLESKTASWFFSTNYSNSCDDWSVSTYLQYGGYPIFEKRKFSKEYFVPESFANYSFTPSPKVVNLEIRSPHPGFWYLLAFMENTKKSFSKLPCTLWLSVRVKYVIEENIIDLFPEKHNHQELLLYHAIQSPQTYKFFTGPNIWSAIVSIYKCQIKVNDVSDVNPDICPLRLMTASKRPPDITSPQSQILDCQGKKENECNLTLAPQENSWHYITVLPTSNLAPIEFSINVVLTDCPYPNIPVNYLLRNRIDLNQICIKSSGKNSRTSSALQLFFRPQTVPPIEKPLCGKRIHLDKYSRSGAFSYSFALPIINETENERPTSTHFSSFPIHLNNDIPNVLEFTLDSNDIGGTLSLEITGNRVQMTDNTDYILQGCLSHEFRTTPRWESKNCGPLSHGVSLNVSKKSLLSTRILIPYPSAGTWYLSLLTRCFRSFEHGILNTGDCLYTETPILVSLHSDMCVHGNCGKYGRCYQIFSGGNMFSTCSCFAGWSGWFCDDSSGAISEIDLLASTLLLCLSNLLFLPPIGLSVYRKFYTEAFVYFSHMIFSTCFHACDQDVFSFCVMKGSVLQFCDHLSGCLSVWLTLLLMAHLPKATKSLLQMMGALGLATLLELDKTSLTNVILPSFLAISVLFLSWIYHWSSRDKKCIPGWKYSCCFCLPGSLLLSGGLFASEFLQNDSNRQFIHSGWHVLMALAFLFLLPPKKNSEKEDAQKYLDILTKTNTTVHNASSSMSNNIIETSFKHYADESFIELPGNKNGTLLKSKSCHSSGDS